MTQLRARTENRNAASLRVTSPCWPYREVSAAAPVPAHIRRARSAQYFSMKDRRREYSSSSISPAA